MENDYIYNNSIIENKELFSALLAKIKYELSKDINNQLFHFRYFTGGRSCNDDVELFRGLIDKNIEDVILEEINDLLVSFTPEEFSDYIRLYEFVSNNKLRLTYNSLNHSFNLNTFIIKWLVCNGGEEVLVRIMKDFDKELKVRCLNDEFMKSNGLDKIENYYELYKCLLSILDDNDLKSKKRKTIAVISNLSDNVLNFILKEINISYEDLNVFFSDSLEKDAYGEKFNEFIKDTIKALSHGKDFAGQNRKKEVDIKALKKKVNNEYALYVSRNEYVTYEDFITYYNEKFIEDDFSCFYFMETNVKFKGLTKDIFLLCKGHDGRFNEYREFLYTCDALAEENKYQIDFVDNVFKKNKKHVAYFKLVLSKYSSLLEELKGEIDYTLDGFIYKNIPEEDRYAFRYVVSCYYDRDGKYFGQNYNKSSVIQKENTLNLLFKDFEQVAILNPEIFEDLSAKYYEKIVFCINRSYIKPIEWEKMTLLVLNKIKANSFIRYLKPMMEVVKNNESLVEYYLCLNFDDTIFDNCNYLLINYPEYKNVIDILLEYYNNEIALINLRNEELLRIRERETFNIALNDAISLVSNFVNSDYKSKEAYLEEQGISIAKFNKALKLVMENNNELYLKYISKLNGLKTKRFVAIKMHVSKILHFIVNGIEENGIIRQFNILDYNLMTKMSLDEFYHFVKSANLLNCANYIYFMNFYNTYSNSLRITKESILKEEYSSEDVKGKRLGN